MDGLAPGLSRLEGPGGRRGPGWLPCRGHFLLLCLLSRASFTAGGALSPLCPVPRGFLGARGAGGRDTPGGGVLSSQPLPLWAGVAGGGHLPGWSQVTAFSPQGRLTGLGGEDLPTIVIVAHYDAFGVAPVSAPARSPRGFRGRVPTVGLGTGVEPGTRRVPSPPVPPPETAPGLGPASPAPALSCWGELCMTGVSTQCPGTSWASV